jgi:hypothetical protein
MTKMPVENTPPRKKRRTVSYGGDGDGSPSLSRRTAYAARLPLSSKVDNVDNADADANIK